ncbi:zinc finger protein 521 [Caerostris extrusa]|uniref:Zinc finger protein 521 n=1 Tax=Caerostris extrusa TaxID=172846 RepID=A0AAV4P4D9_CAEEX|nr:zinc finger protein 521 [Caerostris extrusa]
MLSLPQNEEEVQNLSMKSRENGGSTVGFSSKASFRCDMCDSSFSGETTLNVHRRQVHNIRNSGSQKPGQTTLSKVCAYCNESYKSRTELENHMKSHGSLCPSKHKCNICDEICPSAATLADHKISHCKVVTDNTCVTCHTPLKLAEHFYAHLKQHNAQGLPASCVVCRQVLMSEIEVEKHADHHLKNTESSRFCCVCGETSPPEQLIVTGTQNSHSYMCRKCFLGMNGEDLRCFECKVKFETFADLEKHKLNHVHTYNCIKCQMNFSTNEEAQAHIKTHVSQEGPDHRCHICPKVFDTPFKLTCHLIEHNFEPSSVYACYMCEASFTSPHLIRDHMVEHGMHVRRFDCLFCYQRFFFKAELDNHLIFSHPIPTNSTDLFQCKVCGQFFTSPEHLEEHSKYHGKQSPTTKRLKCSLCPESFDSVVELKQHHFGDHNGSEIRDFKISSPALSATKYFHA